MPGVPAPGVRIGSAVFAAAAAAALLFGGPAASMAGAGKKKAPAKTAPAPFKARGSVGDAYVLGARSGQKLMLVNRKNRIVRKGKADRFGSKIFYSVPRRAGYTVRARNGNKVLGSKKFRVLDRGQNPKQSFYRGKTLHQGLNYVKMRDGVELAMTVRLPAGKTLADGPFPTFIEHSGYQTAAPNNLLDSFISGESDPLAPASSTAVGSLLGPLLDFATVSVQMRGSGCSGGAFDLFGLPTTYDGYDAVETVGNQEWVKGGKVGLGGISFSGITQLFAAGTRPPHLAAITPMSVTDDNYLGTGNPGGIFNKGFALSWIEDRLGNARPAPEEGSQIWAQELVKQGDQHCINNQELRLQTRDAVELSEKSEFRTPSLYNDRSPGAWIKRINVPTFLIGQFQDEQTGGHFPESLGPLRKNPDTWINLQNGVHADSLGPSTITRWAEFMNLFVADRIPKIPGTVLALSDLLYQELADAPALPVEQSRFADYTDVNRARDEFRKDPHVRLLMDNGAAIPGTPGAIGAAWELGYNAWPINKARATRYFLGRKGKLGGQKGSSPSKVSYKADPRARPAKTLPGDGGADAWKAQPPYDWAPLATGKGLGFTSPALQRDVVIAGPSSLDLFLKSNKRNTDLQVTLSEVRPDGKETYVQNGWLRATHRKLDKKRSTANDPFPTHLKKDGRPLPKGKFTKVRVPVYPVAHAFRAGSRIRVTLQATGGDRPRWDFDTVDRGKTRNTIMLGGKKPSKLVLPVLEGATANGTPLPPATALRGQPSRDYALASNGG